MNNNRPIIALDFATKEQTMHFLAHFPKEEHLSVKVGMALFYREGASIVQWLKQQGHAIFLDLKLHDIPSTVENAMQGLANLGISLTTIHAAGGINMMKAALRGLSAGTPAGSKRPLLIAVTQLTSTSEKSMQEEQLIHTSLSQSVIHYARCTQQAGLDGVVCSAQEAAVIHQATADHFICVTPGIRPQGSAIGDQQRIVTPAKAQNYGANYIVVGRPIHQACDPYRAYCAIKNEWNGVKI